MKLTKTVVAVALVIVLTILVPLQAFADMSNLTQGQTKYKTYSISSSPSYSITVTGNYGDKVTIQLHLNDLEKQGTDSSTPVWMYSNSVTITIGANGVGTATISPGSSFNYVSGRSDKARLKMTGATTNKANVWVTYPGS